MAGDEFSKNGKTVLKVKVRRITSFCQGCPVNTGQSFPDGREAE